MYGCERWTIKKAERQRIDVFELWCWRRLLRVPWTARRFNRSILKEISPEYSLEGLMLKLKLQYFVYLMRRDDSFEKTLMLGRIERGRRREWQRMRWLDGITDSMDMSLSKPGSWWCTGTPGVLQSMGLQSQTQLSDWTELTTLAQEITEQMPLSFPTSLLTWHFSFLCVFRRPTSDVLWFLSFCVLKISMKTADRFNWQWVCFIVLYM